MIVALSGNTGEKKSFQDPLRMMLLSVVPNIVFDLCRYQYTASQYCPFSEHLFCSLQACGIVDAESKGRARPLTFNGPNRNLGGSQASRSHWPVSDTNVNGTHTLRKSDSNFEAI